jgi:hypothetical protein
VLGKRSGSTATLAAKGTIGPDVAGAVVASLTRALINLLLMLRSQHPRFRRHLVGALVVVAVTGVNGPWRRRICFPHCARICQRW